MEFERHVAAHGTKVCNQICDKIDMILFLVVSKKSVHYSLETVPGLFFNSGEKTVEFLRSHKYLCLRANKNPSLDFGRGQFRKEAFEKVIEACD